MKILIIDDDTDFLLLCKQYLQRFNKDITIITSVNPKEVVFKIFKKELDSYDAIISDYQMDIIDGVLINKYLKSKSVSTPFILISSSDYTGIRKKYSNQICDYFVQKKLIMQDFCQEIIKCLSRITNKQKFTSPGLQAIFSENVNYIRN